MENRADRNGSSAVHLYRMLPSVNDVLLSAGLRTLSDSYARTAVANAARNVLQGYREEIARGEHTVVSLQESVDRLPAAIACELSQPFQFSLRRVINATGVILHTNLGRAPLSQAALAHVIEVAKGYSNLELDLDSGERGRRDVHTESLILNLVLNTGVNANTHRAIVVNNCAAATFVALHALAYGKEVIVSRGELVEIGGGFRIPEILKQSGALIREVGTTNRTRLADYENAISEKTGLILRVHQSNFSMDGFVTRPRLEELVELGKRRQVPLFEDHGTGLAESLKPYGVEGEATLMDSVLAGCDLVAASGDKLLGGPQCGILIGSKGLVENIRSNPLFRTFRVDKLIYAALEATLIAYRRDMPQTIPVVRMTRLTPEEIRDRCEQIVRQISGSMFTAEVVPVESLIGGGTAPRARLQSYAIALKHPNLTAESLLLRLRRLDPPVIGRISDDCVLLDLRTVEATFDATLVKTLNDDLHFESTVAEGVH